MLKECIKYSKCVIINLHTFKIFIKMLINEQTVKSGRFFNVICILVGGSAAVNSKVLVKA